MCVISMIGDHYTEKWRPYVDPLPGAAQGPVTINWPNAISREEFDQLKKDVLEMKELLKRAKIYDEKNGQANCELEEKIKVLRSIAQMVGVSLDDIFERKTT